MAWMDRYERDVLGQIGAARYQRPPAPALPAPPEIDSGIPEPAALMTPVQLFLPPTPVVWNDNGTLFGEMLRGFIDGLKDFVFGDQRGQL